MDARGFYPNARHGVKAMAVKIQQTPKPSRQHDDTLTRERIQLDIAPPYCEEFTATQPSVRTQDEKNRGGMPPLGTTKLRQGQNVQLGERRRSDR
eukprot:4700809-Amphidinium_carterae.1